MPRLGNRRSSLFTVFVFTLPFIAILVFFSKIDVYNDHFFDRGITGPYSVCRSLFVVYLLGAVSVPGIVILSKIGGEKFQELLPLSRLTVGFFFGAALSHASLLILGLFNLYSYPLMSAICVIGVALTPIYLRRVLSDLWDNARKTLQSSSLSLARMTMALAGMAMIFAVLLLLVKGLYPAGGHDYFNHYHGYYEAVIRNRGIWPNEVWYQFYYSKGMGLFFLATLVTDPLAPSLVTYCFAIAVAMALFQLIDRMLAAPSFWPWIAVIAYLAFYTFTPGFEWYKSNGGWGDFEKPHEINAAFVVAFLWFCIELKSAEGRARQIWLAAAAACIFIVATIELITVLILGLFTMLLVAIAVVRRQWREAKAFFVLSVVGGCGLVGVLVLNFVATGLLSDQLVLETFAWADVAKLSKWGALPYVILLGQGQAAMTAEGSGWLDVRVLGFCLDLLRLDLIKPLLIKVPIFAVLFGIAAVFRVRRRWRGQDVAPLGLLSIFLVAVAVAAAASGVAQRISFYRYTSFCLPVAIGLACCGWLFIIAPLRSGWPSVTARYVLPIALLIGALGQFWVHQARFLKQIIPNALAFADGSMSLREAYGNQQGWPGRMEWGGIFPGMVGAWQAAGPGSRIWSMHLSAYCMLPHCRSETFFSFILSPHLLEVLAGSPEEARAILQRENLNYFFYTSALDINDILPLTKLFAPDQIGDSLGVKWTDGSSFLLTWLGPGITPLTPEWIAQYKHAVAAAPYEPAGFPLKLMLNLREQLRGNPRWGSDLKLQLDPAS